VTFQDVGVFTSTSIFSPLFGSVRVIEGVNLGPSERVEFEYGKGWGTHFAKAQHFS
jgi:hypothetical protein